MGQGSVESQEQNRVEGGSRRSSVKSQRSFRDIALRPAHRLPGAAATLLVLAVSLAAAPLAGQVGYAIRTAGVVDPVEGTTSGPATVLVHEGRIERIGAPDLQAPDGYVNLDLSDRFLAPGLFDAHTHLAISLRPDRDGGEYLVMEMMDPPGFRALLGAAHAREMLEAGFTTVRDVGNSGNHLDADLRRAVRAGLVDGPDILTAGRIIAPWGGQHYLPNVRDPERLEASPEYIFADTRDELRKAVRQNAYHGVDWIKVVVDPRSYRYSEEDLRFLVEEARAAGLPVAAHAQSAEGARAAANAGVASIEHGWTLEPDVLATMVEKEIPLVSTDFTEEVLGGFGWDRAGAARIHASRVGRLRDAFAAGVTLVFGSDVMVPVAGRTRGELAVGYVDSYREAGVPAVDAFRAFTVNAARLLGVADRKGRLADGFVADMIAVPRDPLEDLDALREVSFVMKAGKLVRHDPR